MVVSREYTEYMEYGTREGLIPIETMRDLKDMPRPDIRVENLITACERNLDQRNYSIVRTLLNSMLGDEHAVLEKDHKMCARYNMVVIKLSEAARRGVLDDSRENIPPTKPLTFPSVLEKEPEFRNSHLIQKRTS